ncbi:radical SAM family heme chaperone HemW [Humidisolicoccus flavus]|uniref:radical SAM family heme chaperone HemW n=1 Tax=Humidisolicoccus flavus TaxID=3111414 RepID=UPI003243A313
MAGRLPDGEAVPESGSLPESVSIGVEHRALGAYVHVPFCRVRCGYCDFNTYTASELRGAKQSDYADDALAEMRLAATVMRESGTLRDISTVFFGGGTPTLLPTDDLRRMLDGVKAFGLAPGAEVSIEANPDSVDATALRALADAGFTRVSFGMQSAVPHVLQTLDRTHDPERVPLVVQWAKDAGLETSLDLIYSTPGESIDDWRRSLDFALAQEPDHISAYALIIEDGTALARRIRRGELPAPSDDAAADAYELADALLAEAGYDWYEVSNWAKNGKRSRHNLSYWTGEDWWGFGPGAHSHIGGVRWWNVKHPAAYAQRVRQNVSPAYAREVLDDETRRVERVLLESRVRDGLDIGILDTAGRTAVAGLIADGLIDAKAALGGRVVPTLRGRLLADSVVRKLLP